MQTIKLTMAQALVKFLNNQFVMFDGEETKFVYGYAGVFGHGNVLGLGQALEQYKDEVFFVQGKNEQDIAHMCTGFAKQKRRLSIFACTASIGPGSLNMVTAAATATVNKIPLLVLPSDTYADRQPDPVLQQIETPHDYSITSNDSFKAVSKYWDRILRPEQLMTSMINAMRVLTDQADTGAVTVCIPQDVQGESYDYPTKFFEKRIWHIDRMAPSTTAIDRIANIIKKHKRPFIICGGGVRYSKAGKALLEFAKEFNIPFGETQAGKGEISSDEIQNMGGVGVCGTLCANTMIKQADVVIAIGTKLNDFATSSKMFFSKTELNIVSINISRMDALKMDACCAICDAKEGIEALHKSLKSKGYCTNYSNELNELIKIKQKWLKERENISNISNKDGLSQAKILIELNNNLLHEDDIVIAASGSMPSDLQRIWNPKKQDTYHVEYGFSCMGYEISAALGAKIAEPSKEVYAFIGDGVFLMAHSDLVTSLQEDKKINIILFDNSGHQCIHNLQRSQGSDTFGTEFRYKVDGHLKGDYIPIDYAKIAEGYGAKAYRVTTMEELKEAIEQSKKDKISTLIDIKVLAGTMTKGYESFWRVGTASVSDSEQIKEAYDNMRQNINNIRKY